MGKILSISELDSLLAGKFGRIYIARKGTVTVYEMQNGNTYLINNLVPFSAIVNPAESYWIHSIDWQGNPYAYFMLGMGIAENMIPRAEMTLELTEGWINKIEEARIARIAKEKTT